MSLMRNSQGEALSDESQTETFRQFFKTYNDMSELCFNTCVWDFGTDLIRGRESRCVDNCVTKYLETNKEIGNSFTRSHTLTKDLK